MSDWIKLQVLYRKYMHSRSCNGCNHGKRRKDPEVTRCNEKVEYRIGSEVCIDIIFLTSNSRKSVEEEEGSDCIWSISCGFRKQVQGDSLDEVEAEV